LVAIYYLGVGFDVSPGGHGWHGPESS
jgi:hypothetical protein